MEETTIETIVKQELGSTMAVEPKIKTWADMQRIIGPIEFEWKPWLANGFLTIIAGASGNGKSILALRMAGCYLKGLDLPDGGEFLGEKGSILWAEAEAAQALNLERATKWRYPLEKIYLPFPDDPLLDINLEDISHKNKLMAMANRPEIKLVIVDSLSGVNRKHRENDPEIMNITRWLAELARDINKPIILTHHLRKKSVYDSDEVTLDRLRGSSAIAQHARVIWAVDTPDRNIQETKRLSVIKNNFAKFPDPLGMRIEDAGINFCDAPDTPQVESQTDKAIDLLLSLLADGPVLTNNIEEEMKQAGISWRTAQIAKKKIGVISKRESDRKWYWGMPVTQWI